MRRTKIVATLGPASTSEANIRKLMLSGVNIFRLNFSHGDHATHAESCNLIDKLNDELDLNVGILADLSGPKIRTGNVEGGSMILKNGEIVTVSSKDSLCTPGRISINYPYFAVDVKDNENILLDDGKLLLRAIRSNNVDEVQAEVIQGGILSSRKGVNLPDTNLRLPSLSEKDLVDLDFIMQHHIQWVALSFVRTASDIEELRNKINAYGKVDFPRLVAKMEKPEAIINAEEIIKVSDAIMVARGDLGVEIPLEKVPIIQKRLIHLSAASSKPVIVATQMMEGMIESMRPTRAEVSDVANSVLDGADALMLSGETSVGKFPVETVQTMNRIILDAETFNELYYKTGHNPAPAERTISDSIIMAACDLAQHIDASAIVAMTYTGYSAFKLSSHRPKAGVFIFSNNRNLLRALSLVWGVRAIYYEDFSHTDIAMRKMRELLCSMDLVKEGDYMINISSIPMGQPGKTNMLKLTMI
ncbi:MAG: pyruvate kinase [Lentimicrobiaceae bacterium]